MAEAFSGGCQCGAVRYRCEGFGRASICHCRMCQKAFGGFYAPLVTAKSFAWTRGEPGWFQSSDKVRRGYCRECGTPLAYDWGGEMEISIGSLDTPEVAPPTVQVNPHDKLSYVDGLHGLPVVNTADTPDGAAFISSIIGRQHPDHDTQTWPPPENDNG